MKRVVVLFLMISLVGSLLARPGDQENNDGAYYERLGSTDLAVEYYKKSANLGSPTGQYNLGRMFANGKATPFGLSDYNKAAYWYRKSAEQGHPKAQNNLGDCYENGNGVEQDYKLALQWYRRSAAQGCGAAYYSLGLCYENGLGVKRNLAEALSHYEKAIELEETRASKARDRVNEKIAKNDGVYKNNLGKKYELGDGVKQSDAEAVACYRESAESGCPEGQYNLGRMYEKGKAAFWGHPNYEEAVVWYRKAAEQGLALAQNKLGECYQKGCGVEQNYQTALEWYRKAAMQKLAVAYFNLGVCYENGYGCAVDYLEAKRFYTLGRDGDGASGYKNFTNTISRLDEKLKNDPFVQLVQGKRCEEKEDYKGALHWYRRAWSGKVLEAQGALHRLYEKGYGCETSDAEYVAWLERGAILGNHDKLELVAKMYEEGNGVKEDVNKALTYFRRLLNEGVEWVRFDLYRLYGKGYGHDPQDATYVDWLGEQAEKGSTDQQVALAKLYETGEGVKQDYTEALKWWKIVADAGVEEANQAIDALFEKGVGNNPEDQVYRDWLRKKEGERYAARQVEVGHIFGQAGRFVEAEEWYCRAIESGHESLEELEALYEANDGFCGRARLLYAKWLQKKVDAGDTKALWRLADYYDEENDNEKLFECYLQLVQQGETAAERLLADCYRYGKGTIGDNNQALRWYREAAKRGDQKAISSLHTLYREGLGHDAADSMYIKWLVREAARRDATAQFKLAQLYENGAHGQRNIDEALKLYREATESGHSHARKALHHLFQSGYGENTQDELYLTWLQEYAQENPDAQFKLAQLFEKGEGVERNLAIAEKWYLAAAGDKKFSAHCYYRLGEINLLPARCDYLTAKKWFEKGAALQHADSIKRLKELAYIGPLTRWKLKRMNRDGVYQGYPTNLRNIQLKMCLWYGFALLFMAVMMFFCKKGSRKA